MKLPHCTLIITPLLLAASCALVRATASPLTPATTVAVMQAPTPLAGGEPPVVVDSPRPGPAGPRGRDEPASAAPQPLLFARLA
jgi:hypothetical protein